MNESLERLLLLWDILALVDLEDLEQLQEKIYAYGSSLRAGDEVGRLLFTRMAIALRKFWAANDQG